MESHPRFSILFNGTTAIVDCKQSAIAAMVHWDLHEGVLMIDEICNLKLEMARLKNRGRHHNTQWPYNIGDIQRTVQDLKPQS